MNIAVRLLISVVIGLFAFIIAGSIVTSVITGTDAGSIVIQGMLRVTIAAIVIVSAATVLLRTGKLP